MDSGDNTLDWQVYGAGYVAAVAYHAQVSGGFCNFAVHEAQGGGDVGGVMIFF